MKPTSFQPIDLTVCRFRTDFEELFTSLSFLDPLIRIDDLIENQEDKRITVRVVRRANCKIVPIRQANVIEMLLFVREVPHFVFRNGRFSGFDLCLADQGDLYGQNVPYVDIWGRGPGLFLEFRNRSSASEYSLYVIREILA